MNEQKFQVGDRVRARPFDQIDLGDIGEIRHTAGDCFGITAGTINKYAERDYMEVTKVGLYNGANVYRLDGATFWFAQGMLVPAEDMPEPDRAGLFDLLAGV